MKLALKIIGGLAGILIVVIACGIGSLYWSAATPPHPVGYQEVTFADSGGQQLQAGIWYPTQAAPGTRLIGLSMQHVAQNASVSGQSLPLIVISHGDGGLLSSHSDTALALASAGFVVAALTHLGDNAEDQSAVGTAHWLPDRTRQVHELIDYTLSQWTGHTQLDARRVGMFGFSAGGFTALVSIGGEPNWPAMVAQCTAHSEFACTLWKPLPLGPVPAEQWVHDARIRAAVVVAPGFGFAFEPTGLAHVTAAVQLWNGGSDQAVPYATNAAVIRRLLLDPPEYHAVDDAGHFAFLAPCPGWLLPAVCKDARGFDRAAFHRDFNQAVIGFFQRTLSLP